MAKRKEKSQQDWRAYGEFRDNHARPWTAAIEKETQHPTGPIGPAFTAPVYPPQAYVRCHATRLGVIEIDYDGWENDILRTQRERDQTLRNYAAAMYGQKAGEAILDPPPELVAIVGPEPTPLAIVHAMRAGNKWILGIPQPNGEPYPRPRWVDERPEVARYFEEKARRRKRRAVDPDEFPDVDPAEYPDEDPAEVALRGVEERVAATNAGQPPYPRHLGFGRWELSNGDQMAGKREEAVEAEAALALAAAGEVGPGQNHPAWSDR